MKYTPAGGAIMLRVRRRSSGEIEFSVTDTGPGVPDEDRARDITAHLERAAVTRRQALAAALALSRHS